MAIGIGTGIAVGTVTGIGIGTTVTGATTVIGNLR